MLSSSYFSCSLWPISFLTVLCRDVFSRAETQRRGGCVCYAAAGPTVGFLRRAVPAGLAPSALFAALRETKPVPSPPCIYMQDHGRICMYTNPRKG